MNGKNVYVVGAARTAVGSFQGMYSSTPAAALGSTAIREAVKRSGLKPEDVQEVFMGCVLTGSQGQAPGRQASIFAGIPKSVPCTTVGKVCGSGAQAIIMGARTILLEENDLVVSGGMENMTLAPYALPKARAGYRMGNGEIIDEMVHDGLWDPYNNFHMGMAAELCADKYKFTREKQDDYAAESYKRAIAATKEGRYSAEIVPVVIKDKKKGDVELKIDEEPQKFNEAKMRELRPAFKKDGTVTAGNASSINDAGAALVLASERAVKERGLKPLGRIVGWGGYAQEPEWFTTSPIHATRKALERCSMKPADIDLWEVNEAFAVVTMAAMKELEIPHDRLNINGGACSIGHPIGCSGARIMVTLLYGMEQVKARKGLGTMCIGGGEALAIIFEK
jgi:acetyl-CoA C-acetyltransferase